MMHSLPWPKESVACKAKQWRCEWALQRQQGEAR